jgi:hypothetical protein
MVYFSTCVVTADQRVMRIYGIRLRTTRSPASSSRYCPYGDEARRTNERCDVSLVSHDASAEDLVQHCHRRQFREAICRKRQTGAVDDQLVYRSVCCDPYDHDSTYSGDSQILFL